MEMMGRRAHLSLFTFHFSLFTLQEAMELVKEVYQATADFPASESSGFTNQLRRAAVFVPSNILTEYSPSSAA